nr:protein MRP-126-like [Pogona vitticeps]
MATKTPMQAACDQVVEIYERYANKDDVLDKHELKKLVEEQFPDCHKHIQNNEAVHKLFQELDKDKNGTLDFLECMAIVARYVHATHEKLHGRGEGKDPHCHPHGHPHGH